MSKIYNSFKQGIQKYWQAAETSINISPNEINR